MSIANSYPVFEADQVLTNDHLNELFNYLDQQNRLTRSKLVGSGIVCGLEITHTDDAIIISKGCALTSQGYQVILGNSIGENCDMEYTHYTLYAAPSRPGSINFIKQCGTENASAIPFYKDSLNANAIVFQLLTKEQRSGFNTDAEVKPVSQADLSEYIVVLFLEAEELNLKNCDTNDCNDKGSRMDFDVKALLVPKIFFGQQVVVPAGTPASLHHIELKRYNVVASQSNLHSANSVLLEFRKLVNDTLLAQLKDNLNYCWQEYNHLFKDEGSNPFQAIDLVAVYNRISNTRPVLIQYFYDFIDDLIKAFHEFRHKLFDVTGECCPDEMRFPFTIKLGEATVDTIHAYHSTFREYFIYSSLFDRQGKRLEEIRSLFTRMKKMVNEFSFKGNLPDIKDLKGAAVKVTPSRFGTAFLSDRCIPYYYNAKEIYPWWSYQKTRTGKAGFNQGYRANEYSPDNPYVTDPLSYDIEKFDFFRIEGHIGKHVNTALSAVINIKQEYNLPFEVMSLSADALRSMLRGEEPQCIVEDLESNYRVLIAEFICKLHDAFCPVYQFPYQPRPKADALSTTGDTAMMRTASSNTADVMKEDAEEVTILINNSDLSKVKIKDANIPRLVGEFQYTKAYRKGTFLEELCGVRPNSIGQAYLNHLSPDTGVLSFPIYNYSLIKAASLYTRFFGLIDSIENMFSILVKHELSELNMAEFKKVYALYEKAIRDLYDPLARITNKVEIFLSTCIVAKLEALIDEYNRRVGDYKRIGSFINYLKNHGGVEHKAGVSRGGTFIIVYHEKKDGKYLDLRSLYEFPKLGALMVRLYPEIRKSSVKMETLEAVAKEFHEATFYKDPEQFQKFKVSFLTLLNECKDIDPVVKESIKVKFNQPPPVDRMNLEDGMAIADFYVPYLCCSDCSPVAYILPPLPKDETITPTISMEPLIFCSGEEGNHLLSVNPKHGNFTISNGATGHITRADNDFYFNPKGLSAGLHFIKYEVPGQQPIYLAFEIIETPQADFSYNVDEAGEMIHVSFINETKGKNERTSYEWSLNGKKFSDKEIPSEALEIPKSQENKRITLKASNGICSTDHTKDIEVEMRDESRTIILCSNKVKHELQPGLSDADGLEFISNADGIKIDDLKLIVFPKATEVTQTTSFDVVYRLKGRKITTSITLLVVNSDFNIRIQKIQQNYGPQLIILTLTSSETHDTTNQWKIKPVPLGSGTSFTENPQTLYLDHAAIMDNREISIQHNVMVHLDTGECKGIVKKYVIPFDKLQIALEKKDFDNHFPL